MKGVWDDMLSMRLSHEVNFRAWTPSHGHISQVFPPNCLPFLSDTPGALLPRGSLSSHNTILEKSPCSVPNL